MLMTVEELRQYIVTEEQDAVLEARLQALEVLIRKYTNNNFQNRHFRFICDVSSVGLIYRTSLFGVGDTVQLSDSPLNEGIYTIVTIDYENGCMGLNKALYDEKNVMVTKVEYPMDIKMGAVNLIKWELENRSKVGIQSEAISRHSVTYFNMDGDNSFLGYPKSLTGFLKPYRKAQF